MTSETDKNSDPDCRDADEVERHPCPAATAAGMTLVPRERADVQRFFADWEVIDPGVVPVMTWHPDGEPPTDPHAAYYWAGLARKP